MLYSGRAGLLRKKVFTFLRQSLNTSGSHESESILNAWWYHSAISLKRLLKTFKLWSQADAFGTL
jgi:hypothetical protein